MANAEWHLIPVREIPRDELVAEKRRILAEYEERYAMPSAETNSGLSVDRISDGDLPELIASNRRKIEEYEQRYELASASMAELIDRDAIVPSIEVINWYHTYAELKFLLETTPTTGTPGTTTSTSNTAG